MGLATLRRDGIASMDAAAAGKHREVLARTRGELQADADALEARRKNIETQIGQYMERAKVLVAEDNLRLARRIVNSDTYGDAVVVETAMMAIVYGPHSEYATDPDVLRCWP